MVKGKKEMVQEENFLLCSVDPERNVDSDSEGSIGPYFCF